MTTPAQAPEGARLVTTPSAPAISRDDLLWLAGLVEGEACVDLHRQKYPRIRIGMTDRDVVGRAATIMGAGIRLSLRPAPNASTWHTELSGPRAADVMRQLLPHMGARRSSKIAEILAAVTFPRAEHPTSSPGPRLTRPPGIRASGLRSSIPA